MYHISIVFFCKWAQNLIEPLFEINQVEEHMYTVHFLLDNNAIIIFLF